MATPNEYTEGINQLQEQARQFGPNVASDMAKARHEILLILDKYPTGIAAVCMVALELMREHKHG